VRESSSQKLALLGGEIHVADGLSDDDIVAVGGEQGFVVEDHETLNTFYLKMNCQKGPTADRNVRLAVAHLLNYEQFQAALNNRVTMLTGPMPPAVGPQVPDLPMPTYDPVKAKEYLAASQWPDGGFELEYIPISGVESETIPGLMLLDELQKLNITLNIREVTWSELVDAVSTVETCPNIVPIYSNGSGIPHADRWLYSQFHSSFWGSFFTCSYYKNEEVDDMLYQAHVTSDLTKQEELYTEVQRLLVADAPAIWGFTTKSAIAMRSSVKGFEFCPTADVGVDFRTLWLGA
jgi:peptide/nickel transport system substrate-binding protein